MAVRRGVLDVCHAQGWLDEQAARMAGVAREGLSVTEGDERHKPFYLDAQTLRCFHALSQSPELLDVFRLLFGEEPLAHSRNILRTIFPNSSQITTPAHQDYVQIGGTTETWTTWISLGECPVKLGGLAVSSGLHTKGVLEMKSA
ncbi:MAG: hypothetical protein SGI71_02455 [Verrucomicrobiota bacterium]|nr:hypothetical protein [Verrucomicrobiota bacterium]